MQRKQQPAWTEDRSRESLKKNMSLELEFPYGSPDITRVRTGLLHPDMEAIWFLLEKNGI